MKSAKDYSNGRIVNYVPTGDDYQIMQGNKTMSALPAIIVNTWDHIEDYKEDGKINLVVFCDGPNTLWKTSIAHDQDGKEAGTWHWPEIKAAEAKPATKEKSKDK